MMRECFRSLNQFFNRIKEIKWLLGLDKVRGTQQGKDQMSYNQVIYIYIYPRARLKEGSVLHSSIESFKNKGKFTKMV